METIYNLESCISSLKDGFYGGMAGDKDGIIIAPVFDNGGSFQTKLSEEKIEHALTNIPSAKVNAINTRTAYGLDGHILSAAKLLRLSLSKSEFRKALCEIVPLIRERLPQIRQMFDDVPERVNINGNDAIVCSKERKQLFLLQIETRLDELLLPAYEQALEMEGGEYTQHGAERANERGFDSQKVDSIIDNNYKHRTKEWINLLVK